MHVQGFDPESIPICACRTSAPPCYTVSPLSVKQYKSFNVNVGKRFGGNMPIILDSVD